MMAGGGGMRGWELAQRFDELATLAGAEVEATDRALAQLEADLEGVKGQWREAALALAAVYVPELTTEALAGAERRTGFRGYGRFDPIQARQKEEVRLRADLEAVGRDARYVDREALIGPEGSITRRLVEARDMLEPWVAECRVFEDQEGFLELVEIGYDTPAYAVRWWEPRYWRLWAAGDRICSALGMADFGDDVLPAYRRVAEPRERWKGVVAGIMAEVEEVRGVVQHHDRTLHRLQNLTSIYLDECREVMVRHLEGADAALLETWAEGERGLVVGIRKVAGLRAKQEALGEVMGVLRAERAQLVAERSKAVQKSGKFTSTKRRSAEQGVFIAEGFHRGRMEKVAQRRAKTLRTAGRIVAYDRYDRFDVAENAPELWWWEMTGRLPDRRMELWRYYERHPNPAVRREADEHGDLAAAALGDRDGDAFGDVS